MRYQLDENTQKRLREAAPRRRTEDVVFLLKHPRLLAHTAKVGIRGALNALRSDPTLGWLRTVDGVRALAPDAVLGAEWGGVHTFMALVEQHARADDRCVEIGCGGGRLTCRIRPLVSELVAMDVSPAILEEARVGGGNDVRYEVVEGFGNNLPDGAYSLAVSHDVFVHFDLDDFGAYLANLYRSLQPKGRFVVSVYTLDSEEERQYYRRQLVASSGNARRIRMLPKAAYETLFDTLGFEVLDAVRTPNADEDPQWSPDGRAEYAGAKTFAHLNYALRRR